MQIPIDIDIAKLATLNAVQRRVVYETLDVDVLERHEAEEAVRQVIAGRAPAGRREMVASHE